MRHPTTIHSRRELLRYGLGAAAAGLFAPSLGRSDLSRPLQPGGVALLSWSPECTFVVDPPEKEPA